MTLNEIRKRIDKIDHKLLALLAERQSFMKEVAIFKLAHKLPRVQKQREKEILARFLKEAKMLSLDKELATQLFKTILKNSHKIQKKIMKR